MSKKTAYVQHPLTKEEKKTYLRQGFDRVVDIRFAPKVLSDGDKTFTKSNSDKK